MLQCHEVVPIICLFFFRCLVAIGSPNFVGRVASLSSASLGPMVLLMGDPSVAVPCDVSFGRAVTDSHECELLNAIAHG